MRKHWYTAAYKFNATKQARHHENFYFLSKVLIQGIVIPSYCVPLSFDVASEDAGDVKRDDHLESARWTWLQADHAHVCTGVAEVQAC